MDSIWEKCCPNISLQMKRRSLLFTEALNDDSLLFIDKETQKPLILVFIKQEKVGVDVLKHYVTKSMISSVKNYIFIYENHITTSAIKIIDNFYDNNIEYFPLSEYLYDITSSRYYLRHEKIIDMTEKLEIQNTFRNKLPVILVSDPIVRYFGFKRNDILKIYRKNNEICYREVK